jgi:hypothetical protein
MNLLDIEAAQLAYEDRLRKAEQRWSPAILGFDMMGQSPVAGANGLLNVIKQWVRARNQHREIRDTRRPHAV